MFLNVGDQFEITSGAEIGVYVVVETRDIPKRGMKSDQIINIAGDVLLQTCYDEGIQTMKIVAGARI